MEKLGDGVAAVGELWVVVNADGEGMELAGLHEYKSNATSKTVNSFFSTDHPFIGWRVKFTVIITNL